MEAFRKRGAIKWSPSGSRSGLSLILARLLKWTQINRELKPSSQSVCEVIYSLRSLKFLVTTGKYRLWWIRGHQMRSLRPAFEPDIGCNRHLGCISILLLNRYKFVAVKSRLAFISVDSSLGYLICPRFAYDAPDVCLISSQPLCKEYSTVPNHPNRNPTLTTLFYL